MTNATDPAGRRRGSRGPWAVVLVLVAMCACGEESERSSCDDPILGRISRPTIYGSDLSVAVGGTTCALACFPGDTSPSREQDVSWTVTNPALAQVEPQRGRAVNLHGLAEGRTQLRASMPGGVAEVSVNVLPAGQYPNVACR